MVKRLEGMTEVTDLPALEPRPVDSHKGTFGSVLVAAGSRFMPGAAILAAHAAYRGGAGLVTVCADTDVVPLVAAGITEAVFTDWSEIGAKLAIGEELPYDAFLVGPGLGTRDRGRLVFDLVRAAEERPVILDADALNLIVETPDADLSVTPSTIWTPHPGEFRRLTGEDAPRGDNERLQAARAFVESRDGVLVLKGYRTIVMESGRWSINLTGNPGMATAGSGDVLAGTVLAFLGQGLEPFDAAQLGVYVHGLAGDMAAQEVGEISLTAGDILEYLPEAILETTQGLESK